MSIMNHRRSSIGIPLLAAFVLGTGYAAVEAYFFHHSDFTDLLFSGGSSKELYFRLFIIATVGTILFRAMRKHNLALDAFRESNETLITITAAAKDAIVMMDHQGIVSFWNPAAERIFGHRAAEAIGKELLTLLAPRRYLEQYRQGFGTFRDSGEGPPIGGTLELTAVRKDGTEFPLELSLSSLQLKGKWHAVGVLRDISRRKRSEEELRAHRERLEQMVAERTDELNAVNDLLHKEIIDRARTEEELCRSESFLNTIFDSFHEPFSIVDRDLRYVRFNDTYARTRGKQSKDLFYKKCYEVLHNRTGICDNCVVEETFRSKGPCAKEKLVTLPDGSEAWFEISTYPIFDQQKNVSHVVEYSRDITFRKNEEKEKEKLIKTLNHLSTTDSLTGLLNRRALNEMLGHEIKRASRSATDLSLIICDVDLFKHINDTYGHTAGDRALLAVSEALRQTLRKSDILGRYGGDEFMIILPETSLAGAQSLAEKVRAAVEGLELELPGDKRTGLTLSSGVASCCMPEDNLDTLVSLADAALYSSKEAGRNRISVMKRREPGDRLTNARTGVEAR
jgi:diguanylate cyclase (GGDEF)-like protein/PAS domain S-box-containing protein